MKIEDVRKLAEKKNMPINHIEKFVSEITVDENGDVVDEFSVLFNLNQYAYNLDVIRMNLETAKRLKEKRKAKREG